MKKFQLKANKLKLKLCANKSKQPSNNHNKRLKKLKLLKDKISFETNCIIINYSP